MIWPVQRVAFVVWALVCILFKQFGHGLEQQVQILAQEPHVTKVERDPGVPTPVQRALISMVGYKQIRGSLRSLNKVITLSYSFRLRWYEPLLWNDQSSSEDEKRNYELQCWVDAPGQEGRWILNIRVSGAYTGYGEYYQFPGDMDVGMTCQIRPVNALGFVGKWRQTNRVRISEVPVFLPGTETDIRSLSDDELVKIWDKANKADETQDM